MNVQHERVKVCPPLELLGDITVVEEQIHQHGLAASDAAPQVDALHLRLIGGT